MTITLQNLGVCLPPVCQAEKCSDDLVSRVVEDNGVIYRKLIEHIPAITY